MNKLILTLLLSIFCSNFALAKVIFSKKQTKIIKMITKERKIIKGLKRLGGKLHYRLLELDSEELKIVKEAENKAFLTTPKKIRKSRSKKSFFKKSRSTNHRIEKKGLWIVNKWPFFRHNGAILYTLAINDRDYRDGTKVEKYLRWSLNKTHKKDPIYHTIQVTLAEFYYNKKKYKKAIKFYKKVLVKSTEWDTKHHYNLSWCLLKTQQVRLAIDHAKTAFTLSKDKRFISVKDQVLNALTLYYTMAGEVQEGVEYFRANVKDPSDLLLKMAKRSASNGHFDKLSYILEQAKDHAINNKNIGLLKIYDKELDFYRDFKKTALFWKTASDIENLYKVSEKKPEIEKETIEKISSYIGLAQLRLSKKANPENNESEATTIVTRFNILKTIDRENIVKYAYHQGETYYSTKSYKKASSFYQESLNYQDKSVRPEDFREKNIDSILACLENGSFLDKKSRDLRVYTYKKQIMHWPKSDKSNLFYQKLFNIHLKEKDIIKSEQLLGQYIANYKSENKKHQAMFVQIFDVQIKAKDISAINKKVQLVKKGYLKFPQSFIEKSVLTLGGILFEKHQVLLKQGNTQGAIADLIKLYEDENYPIEIKARAGFQISKLELKRLNPKAMYQWYKKSYPLFKKKEQKKIYNDLYQMVLVSTELQDFKYSTALSKDFIERTCKKQDELKRDFYNVYYTNLLVLKKYRQAHKDLALVSKCKIKGVNQNANKVQILTKSLQNRKFQTFLALAKSERLNLNINDQIESELFKLYWNLREESKPKSANFVLTYIDKHLVLSTAGSKQRKLIRSFREYEQSFKLPSMKLPKGLTAEVFSEKVESYLANLENLIQVSQELLNSGNSFIVVSALTNIVKTYEKSEASFKNVDKLSADKVLVKAINQQMKMFRKNFSVQKASYLQKLGQFINNSKVLYSNNDYQKELGTIPRTVKWRYPASQMALPMNIGGSK